LLLPTKALDTFGDIGDVRKNLNICGRGGIVITTMEQEVYVKVDILENEIEAQLLDSILNERNIPHHIQSYYDTAFDTNLSKGSDLRDGRTCGRYISLYVDVAIKL
jgi:hypothetical protein